MEALIVSLKEENENLRQQISLLEQMNRDQARTLDNLNLWMLGLDKTLSSMKNNISVKSQ